MTAAGQIILDVIVRPVFAVWITLAVNYEKSILYFVLAFISCSLIALTCCCGQFFEPDISSYHFQESVAGSVIQATGTGWLEDRSPPGGMLVPLW